MRELVIFIYLLGFKILFTTFKLFPLKNKITFIVSFSDNSMYIYEELKRQKICVQTVFLCNHRCFDEFKKSDEPTYLVESKNVIHGLVGIYHLATSRQIIVDNYYVFLASTKFRKTVKCTQIWHSVGAIKQFGAKDPSNAHRTDAAVRRFKKVYSRFDNIVVGSDFMAGIFKEAFLVKDDMFLKTGVPRTDFFFDVSQHAAIKDSIYNDNPLLRGKKVILYAPTFRKGEDEINSICLDIQNMYDQLRDDYVLVIKFHPAVQLKANFTEYQDFVFDYSDYPCVNELLVITDVLITDYSSIPMEFALLGRKMIFFAYDLEDYKKNNGLWEDFESCVPGPVVRDADKVIDAIFEDFDTTQIEEYCQKWGQYCDGHSSARFVDVLFGK